MYKEYKIIRLYPIGKKYCQRFSQEYYENWLISWKKHFPDDTIETLEEIDRKDFDNYLEINLPMGISRVGGPVVDLPEELSYPEDLCFLSQLNCSELKGYDELGLLPEKGFLYFFVKDPGDIGRVMYSPKGVESLTRVTREHKDWYYSGRQIGEAKLEKESLVSKYTIQDGQSEWDFFAGTDVTKIFGLYTNCQTNEEETISKQEALELGDMVLLLQIGSDFSNSGTQSVYIRRKDLLELNFKNCLFEYNQS